MNSRVVVTHVRRVHDWQTYPPTYLPYHHTYPQNPSLPGTHFFCADCYWSVGFKAVLTSNPTLLSNDALTVPAGPPPPPQGKQQAQAQQPAERQEEQKGRNEVEVQVEGEGDDGAVGGVGVVCLRGKVLQVCVCVCVDVLGSTDPPFPS